MLSTRREALAAGEQASHDDADICQAVNALLKAGNAPTLRTVINLTGTVLHSNLGRASLPQEAIDAVARVAGAPSNLEYDLELGRRGDRESHIESMLCELTGAEAATAVNNNAAAVLLVLNTLAMNQQVPVSRGELVEIGGSFRIPEVMQRSNCTLVEIGSTNRTHLDDYRDAINATTALLMKVHTSNYCLQGFTHAVAEQDLAKLAHERGLPFVIDLGSGSLIDFAKLGLPEEPTVASVLASGADIVTFSGDKLLGGPQCGFIVGRAEFVDRIRKNPLKRALRLDKMTLAAIAEVLKLYRNPATLCERLPTLRLLTRAPADIRSQAERLCGAVQAALPEGYTVNVNDCQSQIGSGALPVETLPSAALCISSSQGDDLSLRSLASALRKLPRPVIGRIHKSAVWLDLRCLEDDAELLDQLDGFAL